MARLINLDRLTTTCMGGLLPELGRVVLPRIRRLLDIGCGPGGWVQEVALAYPKMEAVGIDISQLMIEYAQAQAQVQRLQNAQFAVMDATGPLSFPDRSFDLVNARFIGFLPKAVWPAMLLEWSRITQSGGLIRLTEIEGGICGITSSPALEKLNALGTQALFVSGHGFSPDGRHMGTTPQLARLLREAGYQQVQQRAHVMDYSAGTPAFEGIYQNNMISFKLIQPFLVQTGVTTQAEVDQLYDQMLVEMRNEDFCGLAYLLTVWGKKP